MKDFGKFSSLLPQAGEGLGMRVCGYSHSSIASQCPSPQPLSRLRERDFNQCQSGQFILGEK